MNKCFLTGNLTGDWDVRITQSGTTYAKNGIAVRDPHRKDTTYFFDLTVWNQSSVESLKKYTHKGSKLNVICKAVTNVYTNASGNKVRTVDFNIEEWEFGESRKASEDAPAYTPGQYTTPKSDPAQPTPAPRTDSFMRIPDDAANDMPFT